MESKEQVNRISMKILDKISGEQAEFLMKLTKVKDIVEQSSNLVQEFVNSNDEDKILIRVLKDEINSLSIKNRKWYK